MRMLTVLLALVVVPAAVHAQPGQTPVGPPPSPSPPYRSPPYPSPAQPPYPSQPPAAGMVPPPYQYVPIQLTAEEQALLDEGEISEGAHIGGAVASLFFGFGIGQAVQGRYGDTGWIFTLGEAASITAIVVGAARSFGCSDAFDGAGCTSSDGDELLVVGVIGVVAFRVWEIADAFGGPPRHNRRVRALRMRLGMPQPMYGQRITPYLHKTREGTATAGLTFRF